MKLLITENGNTREYTPAADLGIISIGRAGENDVAMPAEKAASRKHLTIERTADGWKLVDQMSANGTLVNGEKVNFAWLAEGDVVQVGRTRIEVTGLARAAVAAPAAPAGAAPAKTPRPRLAQPRPAVAAAAKGPSWGIAVAAVAVLALGAGVFWVISSAGGSQPVDDYRPTQSSQANQAEMSRAERDGIAKAEGIARSGAAPHERLAELDALAQEFSSRRGSPVMSRINELRTQLMRQLDTDVKQRAADDLASAQASLDGGQFRVALDTLDALVALLGADRNTKLAGGDFLPQARALLHDATRKNEAFINGGLGQCTELVDAGRFDDALAVLQSIVDNARLSSNEAALCRSERERILQRQQQPAPAPVEDTPVKGPSFLDKIKEGKEERLPGANPLLPGGAADETALLAALHAKLVAAAKNRKLTSDEFEFRGARAKVRDADDERVTVEVAGKDKKTGEEIPYRTKVRWDAIPRGDLLQLYDRTPGLDNKDALALVIFAFDNAFMDEAAKRALELYKAENTWKDGIDILIATKRRIAIPEGGFIEFEGQLIAPAERENALFERKLRDLLARFEKGAGSKDKRKQEDSEKAFEEILAMGPGAVAPGIVILDRMRQAEMKRAENATGTMAGDAGKLKALLVELDKRRAFALELIFDTEKYPYPYGPNQTEVQQEVNKRVAAVREIWNDPTSFIGQANPEFEAVMGRLRAICEKMALLDPGQKHYTGTAEEDIEYIRVIANKKLNIQNYAPAEDKQRKALIAQNEEIMRINAEFPTGEGHCDAEGREQVKVTNEYRIMFGRVALKINDKLFWAAKHHSRWCIEHNGGRIAHDSPGGPRGNNPGERMRFEGYGHGGGENIHVNSGGPTAQSSHEAWCNSSGHHRNILNPNWRVLGSGKWNTIWTQNFGGADEKEDNAKSKGGQ